jgi:2'-5' RNA ligase
MQLGFAILLPDEVHNLLRRLQLRVARDCGAPNTALKQIPHITLKQPFDAKTVGPIEAYFDELTATVRPFEIHFDRIGTFAEDGVIFLDVEANPELEALRLRILEAAGTFPGEASGDRR